MDKSVEDYIYLKSMQDIIIDIIEHEPSCKYANAKHIGVSDDIYIRESERLLNNTKCFRIKDRLNNNIYVKQYERLFSTTCDIPYTNELYTKIILRQNGKKLSLYDIITTSAFNQTSYKLKSAIFGIFNIQFDIVGNRLRLCLILRAEYDNLMFVYGGKEDV